MARRRACIAGALFACAVPLEAGAAPPPPVRIPGGHTRTVFSIHIASAHAHAAAPELASGRAGEAAPAGTVPGKGDDSRSMFAPAAGDAEGRGEGVASPAAGLRNGNGARAAGGDAEQGPPRGLQIVTTSMDRSVQMWQVPRAAGGARSDAWKAAKVLARASAATACTRLPALAGYPFSLLRTGQVTWGVKGLGGYVYAMAVRSSAPYSVAIGCGDRSIRVLDPGAPDVRRAAHPFAVCPRAKRPPPARP